MSFIKVSTNDDRVIEVPQEIVKQIGIIHNLVQLQQDTTNEPIPLEQVDAKTMEKIIEYCMHHKDDPINEDDEEEEAPKRSDDIDEWDLMFINNVEQEMLFSLLIASNYLEIKPLMDLGCKTVANMIRNKDAGQIRQMFNITEDYTEEEKEQIEKENEWAKDHS
ncbi:hypothetical protein FB645_003640 [Coemansia sp. IMI 203386]|nr:hypothetical protein FB645_003640 [Coemansia sp. IMI 203386]